MTVISKPNMNKNNPGLFDFWARRRGHGSVAEVYLCMLGIHYLLPLKALRFRFWEGSCFTWEPLAAWVDNPEQDRASDWWKAPLHVHAWDHPESSDMDEEKIIWCGLFCHPNINTNTVLSLHISFSDKATTVGPSLLWKKRPSLVFPGTLWNSWAICSLRRYFKP